MLHQALWKPGALVSLIPRLESKPLPLEVFDRVKIWFQGPPGVCKGTKVTDYSLYVSEAEILSFGLHGYDH